MMFLSAEAQSMTNIFSYGSEVLHHWKKILKNIVFNINMLLLAMSLYDIKNFVITFLRIKRRRLRSRLLLFILCLNGTEARAFF